MKTKFLALDVLVFAFLGFAMYSHREGLENVLLVLFFYLLWRVNR